MPLSVQCLGLLPDAGRFDCRPITRRPSCRGPSGAGLAIRLGFNREHFGFGEGLGAGIGPASPEPDVPNYAWREYGNRVGAWHCAALFGRLGLLAAALINTALYEHRPKRVAAYAARGDELVACRDRMRQHSGCASASWLSPWISGSCLTTGLHGHDRPGAVSQLNPERRFSSLFEPVHGFAPDIYGRNIANSVAMI